MMTMMMRVIILTLVMATIMMMVVMIMMMAIIRMIKYGDVCFSGKLHCPSCRVKIGSYSWLESHHHHHPTHKYCHRHHHWGFAINIITPTNIFTVILLQITTYIIIITIISSCQGARQ